MIVCLCQEVSDRMIREAFAKGAKNILDIRGMLRVGEICGECIPVVEELIWSEGLSELSACAKGLSSATDSSRRKPCQKKTIKKT